MISFPVMFFWKSRRKNEELVREKIEQLVNEIEALKGEAEQKIQLLAKTAEGQIKELEAKLVVLEERVWLLNQVLASMNPDKRIN